MPTVQKKEHVIRLKLTATKDFPVRKWAKLFTQILVDKGLKAKMRFAPKENGKYVIFVDVDITGGAWNVVKSILNALKSPQGVTFRGGVYHWPSDVTLEKASVIEQPKTVWVPTTKVQGPPRVPEGWFTPEEVAGVTTSGMPSTGRGKIPKYDVTFVAYSTNKDAIIKLKDALAKDLSNTGSTLIKSEAYECPTGRSVVEQMSTYTVSVDFSLKPYAETEIWIFLPSSPKGFIYTKKPYAIIYHDMVEKFPCLKEAAEEYPQIIDYARKGIRYMKLKNTDPHAIEVIRKYCGTGLPPYDELIAEYKAHAKESRFIVRIVPEKKGILKNAKVHIWIDGKPYTFKHFYGAVSEEFNVPLRIASNFIPIFDVNGNPIVHNIKVQTNQYLTQVKSETPVYYLVVWSRASDMGKALLDKLHKKQPHKTYVVEKFGYPHIENCKKIA